MTGGDAEAPPAGRRLGSLLACAVALIVGAAAPVPARGAELSARGFYQLEPTVVDNLDLNDATRTDRRVAFLEHEFHLAFSLRTGAVEAAVGFELADGIFGAQNIRDPSNPFDDSTVLPLSADTETDIIDYFWVRWQTPYVGVRAGWFITDLGSYHFFLGKDGAPSVQLERPVGPLRVQYTFQKVAERAGIATGSGSSGGPVVQAPRSTLVGVGDVDAHYLLLDLRGERLGKLDVRRAGLWGIYAADRRPEDKARLAVFGAQFDLRAGPVVLYGEFDRLEGRYKGTIPVLLDRGPGSGNDEVLGQGAGLRGDIAFAGARLDLGYWQTLPPVSVGVEALRGSGDRDPTDGRAEDVTALTIIHSNLDSDIELSRLFGAFILAGHQEYFERVGNLTVLKPFVGVRVLRDLELAAAVYWLRTTRSIAATLDGVETGERSRDLAWQYEVAARLRLTAGIVATVVYAYLDPGAALRPGGDAAQILYGNLRFSF